MDILQLQTFQHIGLEVCSTFLLFILFWINYTRNISGEYSRITSAGFLVASISDLVHTIFSFIPQMVSYWVPLSWSSSRLALLIMFILISLANVKNKITEYSYEKLFYTISIPVLTLTIGSGFMVEAGIYDFSFVYSDSLIKRPLDFGLLIAWTGLIFSLHNKRKAIFPPYTYIPFMFFGIAVHVIMSFFSISSLDTGFMVAHVVKLAEYAVFIMLYFYMDAIYHMKQLT